MLSGKGNENGENTTVGLISKYATFHVRHTFFSNRETSRNFLVTRFMEEMSYVLFTLFLLPLIFTLVAASIFHFLNAAKKFSSNKNCLLCFLSLAVALCHSFSHWASLACA